MNLLMLVKNFDFASLSSALNNAGMIISGALTVDIDTKPKDSPPDIGCYQGPT